MILKSYVLIGQTFPVGSPMEQELLRRNQLLNLPDNQFSQNIRNPYNSLQQLSEEMLYADSFDDLTGVMFTAVPLVNSNFINTHRPYGWGNKVVPPNVGFQSYLSTGGIYKNKFLTVQFIPEFFLSFSSDYEGFSSAFSEDIIEDKFHFSNQSDTPERFSYGPSSTLWWGQSKITFTAGAFEAGLSTQNIWWGPGQWNALIMSYNAPGFPHLTINTSKPAKTGIGNFEGQLLIGRLEDSGLPPTQDSQLNTLYSSSFTGDWRYLNGITLTYNPKWTSGLFLGFSRTFQQYNQRRGRSFGDYLPIFQAFQKENFEEEGTTNVYDADGRDQQVSVFARWVIPNIQGEIYAEYGKRDHNYNWREALINPEHARAYLFGFKKLFSTGQEFRYFQLRGEITHQQESINRIIRYGPEGGTSWHTHYQARGFSNYGQPLGVGIGTGSNVQTLEFSLVEKLNKWGILLERLANHQDFYFRSLGNQEERKPWVDLSLGFLVDHQWDRLVFSSKVQLINGLNYQWQLDPRSTPDFPVGKDLFSIHAQAHFIYMISK